MLCFCWGQDRDFCEIPRRHSRGLAEEVAMTFLNGGLFVLIHFSGNVGIKNADEDNIQVDPGSH